MTLNASTLALTVTPEAPTMTDGSRRTAIGAVQAAVYAHLVADVALADLAPVLDFVPEGTAFPYVELSEFVELPDSTLGTQGRSVLVTVFAWSQQPGFLLLERIIDNLMRLLDEDQIADVAGSGWTVFDNEVVRSEVVRLPDGVTRQAAVQVRVSAARVDPG
jgi:hypothetical protein